MKKEWKEVLLSAERKYQENKKYLRRLKSRKIPKLDYAVREIHHQIFSNIDCLECANCCCKSSPLVNETDVRRIAKTLKMRPAAFKKVYLQLDEDEDFIFQKQPCPFLGAENYCQIYEVRPRACQNYPHTDEKNFCGRTSQLIEDSRICPAVALILEEIKKKFPL